MCTVGHPGLWRNSSICAFGLGGVCNITELKCDCFDGFADDTFFIRQRDCSMNLTAVNVINSATLILCSASFFFSLHRSRTAYGTAKLVIAVCSFTLAIEIAFSIGLFITHFILTGPLLVIGMFALTLAFSVGYLLVHSLAVPLFRIVEVSDYNFTRGLQAMFTFFRLVQLGFILAILALFSDFNNRNYDNGWNTLVVISLLLFVIELICLNTVIELVGRRLIKQIKILIALTPDNPNHVTTNQYLKKAQRLLYSSQSGNIAAICNAAVPILYLSSGYIPFSYVFISSGLLFIPLVLTGAIAFSTRKAVGDSKKPTNVLSNEPAKDKLVNAPQQYAEDILSEASIRDRVLSKMKSDYLSSGYDDSKVVQSETEA